MDYIIDGYNLFFNIAKEIDPLEENREEFIKTLNDEIQKRSLSVLIVFDSSYGKAYSFPPKKILSALEVVFSPRDLSADQYILEWISFQESPKQITLITSDKKLSQKASYMGVKLQTIKEFLYFLARKERKNSSEKKEEKETKEEKERLLKAFMKKHEK
ncbi:MAG: NYN domain-containing protein [Simkania negevensis]|nr:NYN domain-containing protein [Simkania negevensis]